MSGTLLEIVNDALGEAGFPILDAVAGEDCDEAQTLLRLANRAGTKILKAHEWRMTQVEGELTLVQGQQEYDIPTEMLFYSPETMWNRDTRRPVLIALTPTEWQYYKGWIFIQGLNLRARLQGDKIVFEQPIDTVNAGNQIFYEFRSAAWVSSDPSVLPVTMKNRFDADTDVSVFNRDLMTQCLVWLLKKSRGLDFQDDKAEYYKELRIHMGNDNGARTIRLGGPRMPFIGVNVPDGNFAGFS